MTATRGLAMNEPQTPPGNTEKTDGCAPGCCSVVIVLGLLLAGGAVYHAIVKPAYTHREKELARRQIEAAPVVTPEAVSQLEAAREADKVSLFCLASLAYMFIFYGALELWHAWKPEPFAFGKPLSQLGMNVRVDSAGSSSIGHPLRNARYALPVAAGVLLYDAAFVAAVWAWEVHLLGSIPCGLVAALFNITALVNLYGYLAARVLVAHVQPVFKAHAEGGKIEVAYEVVARQPVRVAKLNLILLGIEAYFPKAKWPQQSVTQRLEVVHRAETAVWQEQDLAAGERRRATAILTLPAPLPSKRGKLLWYVALVAEIPNWPDFEVVEKIEICE